MAKKKEFRGAEAILVLTSGKKGATLKKIRDKKKYRIPEIDRIIRERRTRTEAKLLQKANAAGIPSPKLIGATETEIEIEYIQGEMLNSILQNCIVRKGASNESKLKNLFCQAGGICAQMHGAQIAHGDFTPANLILAKDGKLNVIDFGLGKASVKKEDFAIDYLTFLKSTKDFKKYHDDFQKGYVAAAGKQGHVIFELSGKIDRRSRYMAREGQK